MASKTISGIQPWPEPSPDWEEVRERLRWLWPFHVYSFASLFALLAVATSRLLFLTRSLREKRFTSTVMLAAVFFLAVSRSVMLFVDPYLSSESNSLVWIFFCIMITGLGTTCLTASMAILLCITTISTEITQTHIVIGLHLKRLVFGVTISNFVYLVTSDIVVAFIPEAHVVLTICQTIFATWGILISLGFAYLSWRIRENAQASFEQASFNSYMRNEIQKLRSLTLSLTVLSLSGLVFFALKINEALHGIVTDTFSDTWLWWSLQTALRLLEIINAIVVLFVFKRRLNSASALQQSTGPDEQFCGDQKQKW